MSSKSTITLIDGTDEHIYFDCSCPISDENGQWIGDEIFLELSIENVRLCSESDKDFWFEVYQSGGQITNILKPFFYEDFEKEKSFENHPVNLSLLVLPKTEVKLYQQDDNWFVLSLIDPNSKIYKHIANLKE